MQIDQNYVLEIARSIINYENNRIQIETGESVRNHNLEVWRDRLEWHFAWGPLYEGGICSKKVVFTNQELLELHNKGKLEEELRKSLGLSAEDCIKKIKESKKSA